MSEVMRPMAFEQLVDWILTEKKKYRNGFRRASSILCRRKI